MHAHVYGKVRVCTGSWILKKFLKCAQQFFRPGKSLENRDEVLKNGKTSWGVFFFWKLQQVLSKWNFFVWSNLIQSYLYVCSESWKKLCSCVSLTSLLVTYKYLITVSLENETIVLEKVWEKSWILDPKICTNPESTSPLKNSNLYLSPWYRIILMIQCQ